MYNVGQFINSTLNTETIKTTKHEQFTNKKKNNLKQLNTSNQQLELNKTNTSVIVESVQSTKKTILKDKSMICNSNIPNINSSQTSEAV